MDALLDAADAIVVDAGVDGLTTTLVAARAGVAVGSLYRYFEGVPAVIEGLAARHTQAFARSLEASLRGRTFHRKRDAANAALDALIDYARAHPGFRAIWHGAPVLVGAPFDASADHMLRVVLDAMVADGLASPSDPNLQVEAQIQWATASALILLAFRRDADGDPVVLAHLRHLFTLDIVTTDDVDLNRLDAELDRADEAGVDPVVTLD